MSYIHSRVLRPRDVIKDCVQGQGLGTQGQRLCYQGQGEILEDTSLLRSEKFPTFQLQSDEKQAQLVLQVGKFRE